MLLLVKCYNKKVFVTLQLGHISVDSATGGKPTKKMQITFFLKNFLTQEPVIPVTLYIIPEQPGLEMWRVRPDILQKSQTRNLVK